LSYYAIPVYLGTSLLLCCSYCCIENTKEKGNLDTATHSILSSWCIVSIIVTSIIAGVVGEMSMGATNATHVLIALILACVTLSLSSSLIYWS